MRMDARPGGPSVRGVAVLERGCARCNSFFRASGEVGALDIGVLEQASHRGGGGPTTASRGRNALEGERHGPVGGRFVIMQQLKIQRLSRLLLVACMLCVALAQGVAAEEPRELAVQRDPQAGYNPATNTFRVYAHRE